MSLSPHSISAIHLGGELVIGLLKEAANSATPGTEKKKHIIKVVVIAVLLIITELIFYFVVGEEKCLQEGPIRTLWIYVPFGFLVIDLSAEYIIEKNANKK